MQLCMLYNTVENMYMLSNCSVAVVAYLHCTRQQYYSYLPRSDEYN